MLAVILAAALNTAGPPSPAETDAALAPYTEREAEVICLEVDAPRKEFRDCVKSVLRDDPRRRAYGEAYPWARDIVRLNGWQVRRGQADRLVLSQPGGQDLPAWLPRAWLRTEFRETTADAPNLSEMRLYGFDCLGQRMQVLQSSVFPGNNLLGLPVTTTVEMPKWEYANPGSVEETLMQEACASLRAASN